MQKYASLEAPLETVSKVRYKHDGTPATVIQEGPDKIRVNFHDGVNGIAPGQAAVFYEGDDVVGGGWIMKSFRQDQND
jgi:tRNA-specific 2-thiouridylase